MGADPQAERARRLDRLRGLYAIVGDEDPVGRAAAAVDGGAGAVQVRMKRARAGAILEAARRIAALAAGRALVVVNDRPDLALLAGADGVHLGDEDLPAAEARRLLGPGLLVGRTCRTPEEARRALDEGADHVGFGPVFESRTKPLAVPPRGLEGLAAACAAIPAPVVAISGIDLENIGAVAAAGAAAAAVAGDLFERGDARERASLLARAFAAGKGRAS
ncbi:MAG TPA: thiamine phosphate synthase [Anaeromyxobacteraceae bacterium]